MSLSLVSLPVPRGAFVKRAAVVVAQLLALALLLAIAYVTLEPQAVR